VVLHFLWDDRKAGLAIASTQDLLENSLLRRYFAGEGACSTYYVDLLKELEGNESGIHPKMYKVT
jgi:hypothetical protein